MIEVGQHPFAIAGGIFRPQNVANLFLSTNIRECRSVGGRSWKRSSAVAQLPDGFLNPLILALAPDALGRPKAQSAVNAHLGLLQEARGCGHTFDDIAKALEGGGVRGRDGGVMSAKSLRKMVERAEKAREKALKEAAVAPSAAVHGFWSKPGAVLPRPFEAAVNPASQPPAGGSSLSGTDIGKLKQIFAEAKANKSIAASLK